MNLQPIKLYNLNKRTCYKLLIKQKNMSEKFKLNKEDGLKILKGAGIALAGALLTFLADVLTKIDFGQYTLVVAPILSILINAGLKFIAGRK